MTNPFTVFRASFRRLVAGRQGNMAILFGLCAIPVVVAAGMAVDVTRAYVVKTRLAAALDAAALAVGSESNSVANSTLQTDLQSYFFANYPASALGQNVTVNPIPPTGETASQVNLGQDVVAYQAQATVPMTFMQIIGFNSITVSAVATTQRNVGLEIALVLDNTGSTLCGEQDGAPTYSDSLCAGGVVPSDTTCTNSSNQSRICTLRNAALDFVNILTNANPPSGELYISVVPYVTTVNVGQALCGGSGFSCSSISTANNVGGTGALVTTCGSDFTDQYGNIVDQPFAVYVSVPAPAHGATSSVLTLNSNSVIYASQSMGLGALTTHITSTTDIAPGMVVQQLYTTSSPTNNAWDQMTSGNIIPSSATVQSVTATTITIAPAVTAAGTNILVQFGFQGLLTSGSATVTNVSNTAAQPVAQALANNSALPGSPAIANAWTVSGTGIVTGTNSRNNPERATAISSVNTSAGQVTLCQKATSSGTQTILLYNPVPYDATSVPAVGTTGNASNANSPYWMGCVIEPTSSDETSGVSGVLNEGTDPDETEPTTSLLWYPYWWLPGDSNNGTAGLNNWVNQGITAQLDIDETPGGEVQGNVTSDWDSFAGPNQGCPVPMLALNDVTTTTGLANVKATINNMWPRDAGGTQVGVGMIWGWRVLSPTGPFPQNNGHPMGYSQMKSTAWKKIIVLMTDGEEEWPSADQLTGEGFLQDGKLDTTTSTTTAISNIDARLSTICTNMKATGNFVVYTVALGSDGADNTTLMNTCPMGGGTSTAATTSSLDATFQTIANSILNLRLTQ